MRLTGPARRRIDATPQPPARIINRALEREAWRLLEGDSEILNVARDVSAILRAEKIRGAVVGGVAVGLRGYVRATADVDIYVPDVEEFAQVLRRNGFRFDRTRREFRRGKIPVHLVTDEQTGGPPKRISDVYGITTVSLGDLLNMKLRSGTKSILRAQDLADVIALIRIHGLTSAYASHITPSLRPDFRKIVRAVRAETRRNSG